MKNFGWKGTFSEFISADKDDLVNSLCQQVYDQSLSEAYAHPVAESTLPQIKSWYDSIEYLMKEIPYFDEMPGYLIFEYEMLRRGGKRPDVLLFLPGELLVLEFKRYSNVKEPEYNQLSLYLRDLQSYHSTVQEFALTVRGGLILTTEEKAYEINHDFQVYQLGKEGLRNWVQLIIKHTKNNSSLPIDDFLNGTYQPLPSIIESEKAIMRNKPLPQIKTVKTSNFDTVITEVQSIIENAKKQKTHHLVLVTGVPGAGKTFVGLTLAYHADKAVYLSGNRPLVEVLQDSLQNEHFVQSLYAYKTDYQKGRIPEDHVLIFDEAQRAWDAKKMGGNKSEPDIIMEIAKQKSWSVVVGLIGEGQEIHIGEEGGIGLWNTAIANKGIIVHARHHQATFPNAIKYDENPDLHLHTSLRTHNALMYFDWVEAFLEGDLQRSNKLLRKLKESRYTVKFVDSLEEAKRYVQQVYAGTDKTYGMVMSSGMKFVKEIKALPFGERYETPKPHVAYFNYPNSPYYCRNLEYAATEFQVQGLELDMAIVYWGEDLDWRNNKWKINFPRKGAENPEQMKLNAYRVLLTRGRDGVIIVKSK